MISGTPSTSFWTVRELPEGHHDRRRRPARRLERHAPVTDPQPLRLQEKDDLQRFPRLRQLEDVDEAIGEPFDAEGRWHHRLQRETIQVLAIDGEGAPRRPSSPRVRRARSGARVFDTG
jgi:hypothetical protein